MDKERGLFVQGPREADRFILSVLAGLGVAVVLVLVETNTLSIPLKVALICFSVSIPFHAGQVFLMHVEQSYGTARSLNPGCPIVELPILFSLIGFGAVVFHLWAVAGVIFGISSVLAWIWCGRHMFKDSRVGYPSNHVDNLGKSHTEEKLGDQ